MTGIKFYKNHFVVDAELFHEDRWTGRQYEPDSCLTLFICRCTWDRIYWHCDMKCSIYRVFHDFRA